MKTKDVNTFDLVANPELDKAVVNLSFLQRLTDNLNNTSLSKIIDQLKKELNRCENSQEFLTLLEDELIFHRSVEKVSSGEFKNKDVEKAPFNNKIVGKIDLDKKPSSRAASEEDIF